MILWDLFLYIPPIKTVQSKSAKIDDVLFTKILQAGDTASGTVLHTRCSRICR